jgi:hypothetical protein
MTFEIHINSFLLDNGVDPMRLTSGQFLVATVSI